MVQEHPFAQYVRIIGKGPSLSRPLTEQEANDATRMIMAGEIEPVQLGAFLCLLRVRTEIPEEVAGIVRGIRPFISRPPGIPAVDLDWPSYAGKSRQLPWYLLAVLLLAQNGVRVFMHGTEGHTPDRVYARETLAHLGLPVASSLVEVVEHLKLNNFAYLPLPHLHPRLHEIFSLRSLLGVRSPIHTVARQINPFDAPAQMLSVTHPPYRAVHREAARLLGQPRMAVFKGDGGEAERRPNKSCEVWALSDGRCIEEEWPPLLPDTAQAKDEDMNLGRLLAVWRGESEDDYAVASVTGTTAVALRLLGRSGDVNGCQLMADEMWMRRNRERLGVG